MTTISSIPPVSKEVDLNNSTSFQSLKNEEVNHSSLESLERKSDKKPFSIYRFFTSLILWFKRVFAGFFCCAKSETNDPKKQKQLYKKFLQLSELLSDYTAVRRGVKSETEDPLPMKRIDESFKNNPALWTPEMVEEYNKFDGFAAVIIHTSRRKKPAQVAINMGLNNMRNRIKDAIRQTLTEMLKGPIQQEFKEQVEALLSKTTDIKNSLLATEAEEFSEALLSDIQDLSDTVRLHFSKKKKHPDLKDIFPTPQKTSA